MTSNKLRLRKKDIIRTVLHRSGALSSVDGSYTHLALRFAITEQAIQWQLVHNLAMED